MASTYVAADIRTTSNKIQEVTGGHSLSDNRDVASSPDIKEMFFSSYFLNRNYLLS